MNGSLNRTAELSRAPGETLARSPAQPVAPPSSHVTAVVEHHPSRTALILAFAAIYLIWGSTYLGIRVAIETMPPFLMASARFVIAGAILFVVLKLRGAAWPTVYQWRTNALIGIFLLLGGNGLVVWAE